MQLQKEELAVEAFQETVDLHRLHREMIETVVLNLDAVRTEHGWDASEETLELVGRIRSMHYEDLSNGKWRMLIDFPENGMPDAIAQLESAIAVIGSHCKINSKQELKTALAAFQILGSTTPLDVWVCCLAETAMNQAFDRTGLGTREHRPVLDRIDLDVIQEAKVITEIVYQKIVALLS